jgi:hypothetical protein
MDSMSSVEIEARDWRGAKCLAGVGRDLVIDADTVDEISGLLPSERLARSMRICEPVPTWPEVGMTTGSACDR